MSSCIAADDEEERDEEAEADRREPRVEAGDLAAAHQLTGDQPRGEPSEQQVESELVRQQDEREHEHDDPTHGELRALLERTLEQRQRLLRGAHREQRDADGEQHERAQDRCVVEGAAGREDQRDQQDRAELSDGAGGEQVRAEASLELPAVGQDRDQRSDRGRGDGRAGVEQREHDPDGCQHPADRVRQGERDRPAECGQAQRRAGDSLEVDLVAGEEEQHSEPEVGEELDELRHVDPEHLRPDHDAEQELDDDRREQKAARRHERRERPGRRRRRDDREEHRRLDMNGGGGHATIAPGSPVAGLIRNG
jgi:hypothetical protein